MLIAIAGTSGSGKGTIAQYLAKKHDFMYLSVRNFFAGEVVRQGLAVTRASIVEAAAKVRAEHGPNYALEQLLRDTPQVKKIVVESIRTVGEAAFLKSRGAVLWWVDADIKTRYKRVTARATDNDNLSFEQFEAKEKQELKSEDPNVPSLLDVKTMADQVFNDEGSRGELYVEVEKALAKAK